MCKDQALDLQHVTLQMSLSRVYEISHTPWKGLC